jgi:16S rRNA (uracil1498-N3)-methyltransferase
MRVTRVFVPEPLAPEGEQTLQGAPANHITRVLRLRRGDALVVFDGRGGHYPASILDLRKDAVLIRVGAHLAAERESPLVITLAQGVSRGERMDWVMQKATELGVSRIVPVLTERSVVRLDERQADNRLRHWRAVIVAACEQCGRNRIPELVPPTSLDALLAGAAPQERRLMLSPQGETRVEELEGGPRPVMLLVGPEGGLAEAEQGAARAAGFLALRLGPRVLRTETAALAALTALQLRLGDL